MSKDHFVAQTYLKHFGDPKTGGMLHAYRKTDGKEFPCWPSDVCKEWEGDLNDWLVDNPAMLGDFRKIFEPYWNPAVQTILEGSAIDPSEKFALSGYMANLMVCTPAWRRIGQQLYRHQVLSTAKFKNEMLQKRGKPDPLLKEGLEAIDDGSVEMTIEPDFIRAKVTQSLMGYACLMYDLDWRIIKNGTDQLFVTSDNPVALAFSGNPGDAMTRILPITPRLCVSVKMPTEPVAKLTPDDLKRMLSSPPNGRISHGEANGNWVRRANTLIAQCAEELVFSCEDDSGVRDLVKTHAKCRVDTDFVEIRKPSEPDAVIHGFVIRVREASA